MADLNSMIAQGAQFQAPIDPFVQYGRLQQLQQGQQTNALNQMKMDEYVRGQQESNALRQFLPTLSEGNRNQLLGFGAAGQNLFKTLGEGDTQRRLADQAKSQADLNEAKILTDVVARTSNAVAGIDPNDAPSYMALRESILAQYPKLTPYMPAAWDANVKQRLITTAASVLEGQKPNIAPIDVSKFTPESLQAYLNSKNPASLVAIAPKPVNPYAPIDPSKYTQDSLKAYGLSGQVSDLVPLPTKAANAFAPINVKDFTPESVKAFVASQNPADLVPLPTKAANAFAPINVKDYTPESLRAYGLSGQVGDLVATPSKAANAFAPINPKDYTPESLRAFLVSQNPADLVATPSKAANVYAPINPKDYTPESLKAYGLSGEVSDLTPVAAKADKPTSLINQIDPSKFTPASVAKFAMSQNYADLEPVAVKADKPASLVNQIDASKFTPGSVAAFNTGGDYSLLVPVVSATKADRTIANINPNDFTPKSIDKYLTSGKYADLVPVAKSGGGEGGGGAGGAAGTGTVEVVDPKNPTKTIVVTKARAVAEGLTPAKAMEGLTPVQRQKLEASYPQATSSLKSHQNKSTMFIRDLKALRDHPGLDEVTGFAAGRAPGFTDAGRAAVALYDKVVAKGGFQAMQDLRDASKTGGALGNQSNMEGKQLIASFAAIDRKQNAKDVRKAINDAIDDIESSNTRLQDAYDLTYEYKRGTTAPAAGGVDVNNPLLRGN